MAMLCTTVTQPVGPREGWGVLSLQPCPPHTHTRAGKKTPLVAALMAYTWLEDAVEKGPGVGGEGWGVEGV